MIKPSKLGYGIKVLALARSIRWIGWGFGEALIPLFIFHFGKTFAETGLFGATIDLAALVGLPVVGVMLDKLPSKRIILASLLMYPIVGLSYFVAGATNLARFVIIAAIVNGFTWEMENLGIGTYCRRVVRHNQVATAFGYIETCSHIAWIVAAFSGMILVVFMPLHYLLFAIAPFALLAYLVALQAPEDPVVTVRTSNKNAVPMSPGRAFDEWRSWDPRFWFLASLIFFSEIISSLITFFVPIDAYIGGANVQMVILLAVLGSIPALFGYKLGMIADRSNKYGLIVGGLAGIAVVLIGLGFFGGYWPKLLASILLGIILELFYVVQSSLITTLGPSNTFGRRAGAFESILTLGDLCAPLILGICLDAFGFSRVAIGSAACAVLICIAYRVVWVTQSVHADGLD